MANYQYMMSAEDIAKELNGASYGADESRSRNYRRIENFPIK